VTTSLAHGIPRHSEARSATAATPHAQLDAAIRELDARRRTWRAVAPSDRAALLDGVLADLAGVSVEWVAASLLHKGLEPGSPASAEEWIAGPMIALRNIRLLRNAVADIARHGAPLIPGPVWTRADGRAAAGVFPTGVWDRLFYAGVTAEVWMQPGVAAGEVARTQAVAYRDGGGDGKVALVLGAGNVSSIGPLDAIYKLFVENHVVLYKAHPVNDYLGPLMETGFRRLVDLGVLRIVYGGAAEGAYLCRHPGIGEVHITGSDKTFEAIVFGDGPDGERRRAEGRPLLDKPVTAELGNVSPVIVVPGPWSAGDIRYHAANIVSMLANNAGFNCNAARVIVQHAGWAQRGALLDAIRGLLARVPARRAYYPGAAGRDAAFRAAHPRAERYGEGGDGTLPWTLIPDLDPRDADDACFHTEAFCGLFAETSLEAASVAEYLERAVRFCNETLWGTLNATIVVHPRSLAAPGVRDAVERAIAGLRYGSVSINHWSAISYALGVTTWGAYPGHTPDDIQSGTGVVHNALMFSRPEKTVARAPFRVWPTPPWFVTNRVAAALGPKLARFEARPSALKALGILATAVRG
jgi:acyl-CoA reductase-like NAD-dependent aldehyde dehydrogenase